MTLPNHLGGHRPCHCLLHTEASARQMPAWLCTMALMNLVTRPTVLLVHLPIPPLGPAPIRGNVPLAGAYLKLFAQRKGLDDFYHIEVLPAGLANTLGDRALADALAGREPWLIAFTCSLWRRQGGPRTRVV